METAHKTEPSCQAWRLVDRVAAARTAKRTDPRSAAARAGSHVSALMVVCPHAHATFAEDCDALSKSRGRCAALTAVNGDVWRRPRPPSRRGGALARACRRRGRRG